MGVPSTLLYPTGTVRYGVAGGVYPLRVHPVHYPLSTRSPLATCCTCSGTCSNASPRHGTSSRVLRTLDSVILTSSLVRTPYQTSTGMA